MQYHVQVQVQMVVAFLKIKLIVMQCRRHIINGFMLIRNIFTRDERKRKILQYVARLIFFPEVRLSGLAVANPSVISR